MNPKPNISLVNALIRMTLGFTFLAWGIAKLSKKPRCNSHFLLVLLSSMKIAEGIVRYCPMVALYHNKEKMLPEKKHCHSHNHQNHQEVKEEHHTPTEKASHQDVANILSQYNPADIFDADDMKKSSTD